ncbi:hypothetical protein THAOC_37409 [Thalassiosira oceanica]|uniref:DUS-like FMN-binding domain-containing protein n=1 Tax=Thalassiosira oceanica TaxID=159749 RepID=K0R086_THAOC|nr:hypothetical protein THAOC_37409 [Thalassiosira oceanica]|eukprot:EJK44084.1 hypothetical protein THAOC_37409 [Thalassiosira oceanica]
MTTGEADDSTASSSAAADALLDSEESRSLQNPHARRNLPPTASGAVDLGGLPAQDAADALFRGSEILAPMVRASTTPLRTLALAHGASLTFTEEIIDRAVRPAVRAVNSELGTVDYRVPLSSYSAKVQRRMAADTDNPDSKRGSVLLRIDPAVERNRLVYQVGTGESALALEAASKVVGDVSGIDVNMGCPKKFSVGGGMGSALLGDERRACDIISTLRRNIAKPVSAKIRLLDPDRPRPTLDFVRALINAGANAVTIHGRIVGDEAHVDARWSTLVDVVRELLNLMPIRKKEDGVRADQRQRRPVHARRHRGDEEADGVRRDHAREAGALQHEESHGTPRLRLAAPKPPDRRHTGVHSAVRAVPDPLEERQVRGHGDAQPPPDAREPRRLHGREARGRPDREQREPLQEPRRPREAVRRAADHGDPGPRRRRGGAAVEDDADAHRYDDRYFTDHDKFRRERLAGDGSGATTKGGEDSDGGKAPKRQKVDY